MDPLLKHENISDQAEAGLGPLAQGRPLPHLSRVVL